MDNTDRKLLALLGANPRMQYLELAKRLGISRQAVYHRMKVMKEAGVVQGAYASVSIPYLDAIPVAIYGRSETESVEETLDELGRSEFTRRVVVAGGNYVYVIGILRKISELDGYAGFVRRTAEIQEPTVGIYNLDHELMPYPVDGSGKRKEVYKKLSPLDLAIVASLKDDARKSIADIADAVGVTAKTIRRHLNDMISEGSLDLHMPQDLASAGDLFLIMHVHLMDGADRTEVARRLLSRRHFQGQYIRTFSNHPGLLVWVFWSDKITEIRRALKTTGDDEDVRSVSVNFAYLERIYPTWRDKLPPTLSRPSENAGTPRTPSGHRSR
jgi:DNA-binding Lrp family transcriptional regulator